MSEKKYFAEFRVYRANKNNNGAASKLQFRYNNEGKPLLFISSARQTGTDENDNATFAWKEESVNVKLGELDIGEFLAVLNGKKDNVGGEKGLYHQNEKGNSAISFVRNDKGYSLRVSAKKNGGQLVAVSHAMSLAEGEIMRVLLECVVRRIYQW